MKKYLLSVAIILSCLSVEAQEENDTLISLFKVNYEGFSDMPQWFIIIEDTDATLEVVANGLAITNPRKQDQIWQPQVCITDNCLTFEESHNYIVRMTIKVPSDGVYQVNMGNWDTHLSCQIHVKGSNDFQIIDVEYPEYKSSVVGGHVFLGCGWVVGTTILKEIELLEKRSVTSVQNVKATKGTNDTFYNLIGQKVGTSYKGLVIQNGKKTFR